MTPTVAINETEAIRALADPIRWDLLRRLGEEELCVCHLVEDTGLKQPLISHHLKVLRQAGLVRQRRHSYWTYYRIDPSVVEAIAREIGALTSNNPNPTSTRPCC
jgi:ArsR family transcriptional regulator, arsenate/arsenite/antimonite-responsive transcriptional repressor